MRAFSLAAYRNRRKIASGKLGGESKLARNEKLIRQHNAGHAPIGMRLLRGKIISLRARHRKSAAAFVLECVQVAVQ